MSGKRFKKVFDKYFEVVEKTIVCKYCKKVIKGDVIEDELRAWLKRHVIMHTENRADWFIIEWEFPILSKK